MSGRYKRCLVVLPKASCYSYKDVELQQAIKSNVNKWLQVISNLNEPIPIIAYAEDTLQDKLGVTKDVRYVLGESDVLFVRNNMADQFPESYDYGVSDDKRINAEIIKSAIDKVKAPDRRKCFDTLEWKTKRANTVLQRIRYACNEHMKKQMFVLFFTAKGNNFCNSTIGEVVVGDGRIIVDVDVYTGKAEIKYSGIPISESELLTILGGVQNGI